MKIISRQNQYICDAPIPNGSEKMKLSHYENKIKKINSKISELEKNVRENSKRLGSRFKNLGDLYSNYFIDLYIFKNKSDESKKKFIFKL